MPLEYHNFLEAWEGINESFLDTSLSLLKEFNGVRHARALYLYNVSIQVNNPVLDPEFDFGRKFNYTKQKWNMLMGNYINMVELKELKTELKQHLNDRKPYNISYNFPNTHKHGKKCLLALIITKRYGDVTPYITMYLRSSEVTKRLSVDFLLMQRIGEYLFEGQPFKALLNINQLFNDDTVLLMYGAHKDIRHILKKGKNEYCNILYKRLKEMLEGEEKQFKKYKVHWRAFKVLRPDLYKYPKTLAKECKLPLEK